MAEKSVQFVAIPTDIFISIRNELNAISGEDNASRILYRAGCFCGANIVKKTKMHSAKQSDLPDVLASLWTDIGFGKLTVEEVPLLGLVIECSDSTEALALGATGKPSCDFTRGCLVGVVNTLTGTEYYATEEQCICEGEPVCIHFLGIVDAEGVLKETEDVWFTKGVAHIEHGRYEDALQCLSKALKINPKFADSWNYRGIALYNLNMVEESIKSFEEALNIRKDYAEAWYNKGIALYYLDAPHDALYCFDNAIKHLPRYAEALFSKGMVLYKLGKYSDALVCFDKALEIRPNFLDAVEYRRKCLAEL